MIFAQLVNCATKATELHTLKDKMLWYVNYTSIKNDLPKLNLLRPILGPLTLSWKIPSPSLLPKNKAYLASTPSNVLPSPSTHPRGRSVSAWLQKNVQAMPHAATCTSALEANHAFLVRDHSPTPCWSFPLTGLPLTTHMVLSKAHGLTNSPGPPLCLPLTTHCAAEQPDLKPTLYDVSLSQSSLAHFPFWVVIHLSPLESLLL